ncbi:MAG: hypothetical protein ACREHV_13790 [Rhizomicrobium sp.]
MSERERCWRIHAAGDTKGHHAIGTDAEARDYLRHLNAGRTGSFYTAQPVPRCAGFRIADKLGQENQQ